VFIVFLIIACLLIAVAYFSIPAYVILSVVLYVTFQIVGLGGAKQGWLQQVRHGGFIGWLVSIPFCLVIVYLQKSV